MGHFITTMSIGRSSSESSTPRTETLQNAPFRPQTSVLVRARVLNIEKLEELGLDMALTTKEFLNANSELIMPRRNTIARHLLALRANSPHRADPNGTITHNNNNPTTIPALQPAPSSIKTVSKKDKSTKIRRSKSLRHNGTYDNKEYRSLTSFMTAAVDLGVPKPCTSCSRSDLPERFHSHPPSARHKKSLLPVPKPVPANSPTELKEPLPGKCSSSPLQRSNSLRKPATRSPYRVKSSNSSPASPAPFGRKLYATHTIPEEVEDALDSLVVALCPAETAELGESEESTRSSNEDLKEIRTTTGKSKRFLVCYICGRLFGTTSLKIHEPQCLEKWLRENEALPEHLKRPIPKKPDEGDNYNDSAYAVFESTLLACPNCGRTFLPERLPVHQRACKGPASSTPKTVKSPPNESSHEDANTTKKRQRVPVLCYICGREFGNASLRIHEPQCLQKWHNENQKLPPHLKRPEPQKPEPVINEDGRVDREATWEVLWKSHLDQLTACPNCGRKFRPDRLEVHLRSCRDK